MAESSRHNFWMGAPETVFGETPPTQEWDYLRHTSDGLGTTKTEIVSAELYADRGIRDARHGNTTGAGELAVELSYDSFNNAVQGALQNTWVSGTETVTETTISFAASDNSINDSGTGLAGFVVGQPIEITGATNSGVAVPISVTAGKVICAGITFTDESAGASVTLTEMDSIKRGTVRRSYPLLRDFADLTAGRYDLYKGQEINTASFSVGLDAIITGSLGFMGRGGASIASAPAGATFGAAETTEPLTGHQCSLYEGDIEDAVITALDWSISNGLEAKHVLSETDPIGHGANRADVTGSITAYYDNDTLLNKFRDETISNIMQTFTDAAGNKLGWFMPRVKYNTGDNPVGGEANTPVTLGYRSLFDASVFNTDIIVFKLDA